MSDTEIEPTKDQLAAQSLGLEAPFDARPTPEDPFPAPRESLDLADPALAFNREVSWAEFNDRVLQLAERSDQPLLERVKFSAIYSSNLDEFFMIRVAGLLDQVDAGVDRERGGFSPSQTIDSSTFVFFRRLIVRLT